MRIEFIGRANAIGFVRPDSPFPLEDMAELELMFVRLRDVALHHGKRFRVIVEEIKEEGEK